MKSVLLVGHDVAPSQALQKVADELVKRDVGVRAYFGHGTGIADGGMAELVAEHVDAVICGMSSSPGWAEYEIRTAESAKQMGIPYGFYSDAYGCYQRPWFGSLRNEASFVFVLKDAEAKDARRMFPKAKVVVSGNPMWESFFLPTTPKEEIRSRLKIEASRKMVFCSGGKILKINQQNFSATIHAVRTLNAEKDQFTLVLGPHPGDPDFRDNPAIYDDLFRDVQDSVRVASKNEVTTSELVEGCDLVVDGGASTVSIEGACRRKPVINFFTDASLARLQQTTGKRTWTPCEQCCSLEVVNSWYGLTRAIAQLMFCEDRTLARMRRAQVENYQPSGKPGDAVRMMANTVEQFAAKSQQSK